MSELNPCVTGDTKVITTEGIKSFKELADSNDDVLVYCLNDKGEIVVSKMFHPRITGYKMNIMKVELEDGSIFKVTPNHQFLTPTGYETVDDMDSYYNGMITVGFELPDDKEVHWKVREYSEYTSTKKGSIIKKCEVSDQPFEVAWDERELSVSVENQDKEYRKLKNVWSSIESNICDSYPYYNVGVEELDEEEDVYNGTVAVYHNYFTIDENTGTIVNQLNCGE